MTPSSETSSVKRQECERENLGGEIPQVAPVSRLSDVRNSVYLIANRVVECGLPRHFLGDN